MQRDASRGQLDSPKTLGGGSLADMSGAEMVPILPYGHEHATP